MAKKDQKIYTVSQLTNQIKLILEENLEPRISVIGEITDMRLQSSGHCYYTLKDKNSNLPCVMWASKFSKLKFTPENGLEITARGYIDVYPPHGKYQFITDSMNLAGVGDLQLAFEQMVKKLQAEGLFNDEHKKPLPRYPEKIGILTSPTGAAIHDIADSIFNRWPCVKLYLYPVPVQGEGAAEKIALAIDDLNRRNDKLKLDVLIVGRGGGSLEDLWAFNEEILARAIFNSKIPIISAVGHEIDTTIADLVADKRASTPTKAGVTVVPDMADVLAQLKSIQNQLTGNLNHKTQSANQSLQTILASAVFRHPLGPVLYATQAVDELTNRLNDSAKNNINRLRNRISSFYENINKIEPHRLLGKNILKLNEFSTRLDNGFKNNINKLKDRINVFFENIKKMEPHRLLDKNALKLNDLSTRYETTLKKLINKKLMQMETASAKLDALNPKSVLKRGYSITTIKKTSQLLIDPDKIDLGDILITELADEILIQSKVTNKQNKNK